MPYKRAHWWLLALLPLIVVAFWPNYFGQVRSAPFALHAHGITASVWLVLLTAQAWTASSRRFDSHRTAGLATFVALPLFAAAGPLALWSMITLWAAKVTPFHAAYGARLAAADMIAGPTVIALVAYAFAQRRRVRVHAAAMLATGLTVLPPVLGRLVQRVPLIPPDGAFGLPATDLAFHLAWAVTLVLALALARGQARIAFGVAALSTLTQLVGFVTIPHIAGWEALITGLIVLPVIPVALVAGLTAFGLLWWAWRSVPPRGMAATGAMSVAA